MQHSSYSMGLGVKIKNKRYDKLAKTISALVEK